VKSEDEYLRDVERQHVAEDEGEDHELREGIDERPEDARNGALVTDLHVASDELAQEIEQVRPRGDPGGPDGPPEESTARCPSALKNFFFPLYRSSESRAADSTGRRMGRSEGGRECTTEL